MLIDGTEFKAMNATILRARGRGPGARLLEAVLVLAGAEAELVSHGERPWASATFSGARHTIALTFHCTDGVAAGSVTGSATTTDQVTELVKQRAADVTVTLDTGTTTRATSSSTRSSAASPTPTLSAACWPSTMEEE